jgi:3alpha(or 20beta)-hydroxysteroid dehydrogenase
MTSSEGRVAGKVAVVTGGSRGQGESHARALAAEGAHVVVADVRDEEGEKVAAEIGDAARFVRLDVTSEDSWGAAISETVSAFGRLDILVNNAAILKIMLLENTTTELFSNIVDVNLLGVFLGIRTAVAPMRDAGGGSIVNISSTAGLVGTPGHSAYGATKWGVRGMTKTAALELAHYGIRVNSVHPGPIDTPMLPPGVPPDAVPLHRYGAPSDVSQLVLFLASDESSYITGAEVSIDGGLTAGNAIPHGIMEQVEGFGTA